MWIIRDSFFIGMLQASPLILAAMGFTLIYYLNGYINFAYGETITYGAYFASMFSVAFGLGFYTSIIPSAVLAGVLSVATYLLIFRPAQRRGVHATQLIILSKSIDRVSGEEMMKNNLCKRTALTVAVTAATLASPFVLAEEDIKVGHLTYHTAEYGGFGEFFDAVTDFSLDVINEDPPLGRKFVPIHQDIGTIGEARAARKLIDSENVEILLNAAHSYSSYRDYVLEKVASDSLPLVPSVHGGAIEAQYGGTTEEPLFRGSPMDSARGAAALLHAKNAGKESVVLVATEAAGSQLPKNAVEKAARKLSIEVLGTVDIQPNQANYRSVVSKVGAMEPDAVIVFSASADGGAFVKNAAEAGNSWFIIGTSEWQEPGFISTATMNAVENHESVVLAAFSNAEGPAWDAYKPKVEASQYAESIGDVSNSYAIQYFDLLVTNALAIEKTGSIDSSTWTEAMHEITGGDGEVVHTYVDGIAALREGKDINYDGVTGSMEYTDTGVVAGIFGIYEWTSEESLEQIALADGNAVLELDQ